MDALYGFGFLGIMLVFVFFALLVYVPLVLYLLSLQRCLDAVRPEFRPSFPTALVWLGLVPGIGFFAVIAAIVILSTALKKEDESRQTNVFGDGGLGVGLAFAILGLLSWIPFLGVLLALGSLACWIMHWLKVSGFRKALAAYASMPGGAPARPAHAAYTPQPAPYQPPVAPSAPPVAPAAPVTPAAPAAPVAPLADPTPTQAPAISGPADDATLLFTSLADAKLVCTVGVLQGMNFPVGNGLTIGRAPGGDVVVPDPQISSRHAWVGIVDNRLMLRDLGSTNGTFLNDNLAAPVHESELQEGDVVVLGKHNQMKFRVSLS